MTPFPVVDSILATEPLALFLREKYNLSRNTNCHILRTGINHTYLVTDQDQKYVFRIYSYQWRTRTEILEEIKLLRFLKDNGITVSYPLQDAAGEYVQAIEAPEGRRYGVLFSYADGEKIRVLTEDHCYHIGQLMGQFHTLSVSKRVDRIKYDAESLTQLPYQYATEHFSGSLEEMQFVKRAGNYVADVFQQQDSPALRYGVVHLDLWYDNMNIAADATVTLFDFDFCGNGWLLLDIAYCTMQLFHTEADKKVFNTKLDSFYQGYEAVSAISSKEKALLPIAGLATWIFYLGVQSRRFDNWSNIFLTKNYLKHYISMVKSWLAYHDIDLA